MLSKKHFIIAASGAAVAAFFVITPYVQGERADRRHGPLKLEGAWIMRFSGTPLTAMFTESPDPSGRRATISGSTVVGDPTLLGSFPDAQSQSPLVGEAVVTGSDHGVFTVVQYGMKPVAGALPAIVYIIVDSGTFKEIGPGKLEHKHNLAVYLPFQDADGDGLPDEGQDPVACIPLTSLDTRVPLLPPCTP
jgi:hypothetical protein